MYLKRLSLIPMLMILCLSGCGKKSVDHEKAKSPVTSKTREEVTFELNASLNAAIENNDLESFKDILYRNPELNLNRIMDNGETLLTAVIKKNYRDFRDYLIEAGAGLERTNASKETPMIAAAVSRNLNTVMVLLDKDVDLNKKDVLGLTALHHAIMLVDSDELTAAERKESEELASFLVKSGASVEVTTPEDKNAYRLAVEHNNKSLEEVIKTVMNIEYGTPDVGTFRNVLKHGNTFSLNFMLQRNPTMPSSYSSINPLVLALDYPNEIVALRMIQLLIYYKVQINGPQNAEITPLMKAVKMQNEGFVDVILDAKPNTELLDAEGKSPLYHAIVFKNPAMVSSLLRAGALKKYPFRGEGFRFNFDACRLVKEIERDSSEEDSRKINDIRANLDCGRRSWLSF